MTTLKETALYAPVKTYLEGQGFEVKGEVGAADVVARRGADELLIVELKMGFSLQLLQQAVARQRLTDVVYVAVPRWRGKAGWKSFKGNVGLCRRLGLGVLTINLETMEVKAHADPAPFVQRHSKLKKTRLLKEFDAREGDPNKGGMTRETIMTAYRQSAMKCAAFLQANGPSRGQDVRDATGVAEATRMMRDNHYGWFERREKGVYALAAEGKATLEAQGSL